MTEEVQRQADSVEHRLRFTFTQALVTAATQRFWLQYVGWPGVIRWAVSAVLLLLFLRFAYQPWLAGAATVVVVSVPLIWVVGYVSFLRRALARLARMDDKAALYTFSEETITTRSEIGAAELPWRTVERLRRFPDVWLLFIGRRDYFYLPVDQMTEPVQSFILQQAEKHHIKVI